jgi:serine/threonine protein phosphatase PrpC
MHMAAGLNPVETAGALIDAALASGGRDNITTIVVDVLDAPDIADMEDTAPRSKRRT